MTSANKTFELAAGDVSLIIDTSTGTPVVLHWGASLGVNPIDTDLVSVVSEGVPHADLDDPQNPGIWRENARGYLGRPAVQGHRNAKIGHSFLKL